MNTQTERIMETAVAAKTAEEIIEAKSVIETRVFSCAKALIADGENTTDNTDWLLRDLTEAVNVLQTFSPWYAGDKN